MARVKGIATERLESDKNIAGKTEDEALREILQELERSAVAGIVCTRKFRCMQLSHRGSCS